MFPILFYCCINNTSLSLCFVSWKRFRNCACVLRNHSEQTHHQKHPALRIFTAVNFKFVFCWMECSFLPNHPANYISHKLALKNATADTKIYRTRITRLDWTSRDERIRPETGMNLDHVGEVRTELEKSAGLPLNSTKHSFLDVLRGGSSRHGGDLHLVNQGRSYKT